MSNVSPPAPSPRSPLPAEENTQPGLHAALKRHDAKLTWRAVFIAGGSLGAGTIVAVATALLFLDSRVSAEARRETSGHETRIVALEQQVPQLRAEVYEGRLDTQALYKTVLDGRRQERLEHPPAPPPLPDAGLR